METFIADGTYDIRWFYELDDIIWERFLKSVVSVIGNKCYQCFYVVRNDDSSENFNIGGFKHWYIQTLVIPNVGNFDHQ